MGMYTELVLGFQLKPDTPEPIIKILKFMVGDIEDRNEIETTDHPLFETGRWDIMFQCNSFFFPGYFGGDLKYDYGWYLSVYSNFKNYDDEIAKFLDFIQPWVETDGFIGYMRYEEHDDPTLIYNDFYEGRMYSKQVIKGEKNNEKDIIY